MLWTFSLYFLMIKLFPKFSNTPMNMGTKLIALLLYQGLVRVSSFKSYWSTKYLYHGFWARDFMSRNRYSALMSMIHIVDPSTENKEDKLRKVSEFANVIKEKCMTLYQPHKECFN